MAKRLKGSAPVRSRTVSARSAETELICHVRQGWAPRVAPASSRRGWMDETTESFAYRCLPLSIANSHGWEMLSPCGLSARWHGGDDPRSVEIVLDAGADPKKGPTSIFGYGTLTFHIEGIMRTSQGWNLWVGGPPNTVKDGIAPQGGVIETDWSPYTFTMNWRFTRPDVWIRFEEDEAFCHFFPTPRGVMERLKPELRPMEDEPELLRTFDDWSAKRAVFLEWVRKNPNAAPADKWQKHYYRGRRPDGQPGAEDHESKLRLSPFRQTGSRRVCPVSHGKGAKRD